MYMYIHMYIYIYIYIYSIIPVRRSRGLGLFGTFDAQKHCTGRQTRLEVTSGPPGSPRPQLGVTSASLCPRKLGSKSLRGHLARESSARSHFEVTRLERTRLEVTSGPHLDVTSKSLRRHLAREDSIRGHFEVSKLCKENYSRKLSR